MKIAEPPREMTAEEKQRAAIAAEFMADFDKELDQRMQHLANQCRARTGLPSRVSLATAPVDERVTRFVEFVLAELAVLQVFQGKTFARLLDIMHKVNDNSADSAHYENNKDACASADSASMETGTIGEPQRSPEIASI